MFTNFQSKYVLVVKKSSALPPILPRHWALADATFTLLLTVRGLVKWVGLGHICPLIPLILGTSLGAHLLDDRSFPLVPTGKLAVSLDKREPRGPFGL